MKSEPSVSSLKRKAREVVVKVLYEMEMGDLKRDEAKERIGRKCSRGEIREFALSLFSHAVDNMDTIDRLLASVVENWHISRMAAIDRNILRMGTAEILFMDDVPEKVTINEAIEIAKKFSTADSGRFVNGILDRVARTKSDIRNNI